MPLLKVLLNSWKSACSSVLHFAALSSTCSPCGVSRTSSILIYSNFYIFSWLFYIFWGDFSVKSESGASRDFRSSSDPNLRSSCFTIMVSVYWLLWSLKSYSLILFLLLLFYFLLYCAKLEYPYAILSFWSSYLFSRSALPCSESLLLSDSCWISEAKFLVWRRGWGWKNLFCIWGACCEFFLA